MVSGRRGFYLTIRPETGCRELDCQAATGNTNTRSCRLISPWDRINYEIIARAFETSTKSSWLIGLGENRLFLGGLAAENALARLARLFEGNAPHRGFCFFLDFAFTVRAAAPMR